MHYKAQGGKQLNLTAMLCVHSFNTSLNDCGTRKTVDFQVTNKIKAMKIDKQRLY